MSPKKDKAVAESDHAAVTTRASKVSCLQIFLAGAAMALTLAIPAALRAEMGNGTKATVGKVLKPQPPGNEKSTVDVVCGLGAACQINDIFHASFYAAQVADSGPLEQNFQASGLGFGSIFSLSDAEEDLVDQFCWSGSGVRECVKIFVDDSAEPEEPAPCLHVITMVDQDQATCDAAAAPFSPPLDPDYVITIDEASYAGPITVTTCGDKHVVAQCLPSADTALDGAVGLAQDSISGYDAKKLGGSKYF